MGSDSGIETPEIKMVKNIQVRFSSLSCNKPWKLNNLRRDYFNSCSYPNLTRAGEEEALLHKLLQEPVVPNSGNSVLLWGPGVFSIDSQRVKWMRLTCGRLLWARPGSSVHHFCLHFIGQNSVMWPHSPVREPGQGSQSQAQEENKNIHISEPLPQRDKR